MSQAERDVHAGATLPEAVPSESFDQAMQRELERRITELATCPEAPGLLDARDWIATILLSVLLPLFLVWVYR